MGLGRFQLKDDGRREIAPRLPFPQSDRSTSPVLKSGATPARPISPNILRPVSPNILRNAEAANAAAVTTGFLVTPQRAGISASVASPTRPLVPVASVTASVEAELSTTSSKAARRLSNPRLAAEAASRAAEAAAKAAARGQLYGLEAVKAIARGGVRKAAQPPTQPPVPPSEASRPASAANQAVLPAAVGSLSATWALDESTPEHPATASLQPVADPEARTGASQPLPDQASSSAARDDVRSDGAAARPAAGPSAIRDAELPDAAEPTPSLPMQQAAQPADEPPAQAWLSTLTSLLVAGPWPVAALSVEDYTWHCLPEVNDDGASCNSGPLLCGGLQSTHATASRTLQMSMVAVRPSFCVIQSQLTARSGDGGEADHLVLWAMPPPGSRRMTRNGPASPPPPGEPAAGCAIESQMVAVLPCSSCRQVVYGLHNLSMHRHVPGMGRNLARGHAGRCRRDKMAIIAMPDRVDPVHDVKCSASQGAHSGLECRCIASEVAQSI